MCGSRKSYRCKPSQRAGARTRFAFGPSLAVVGDARLPTYTCPKPPLPSFRSTMYTGEPPTWHCKCPHAPPFSEPCQDNQRQWWQLVHCCQRCLHTRRTSRSGRALRRPSGSKSMAPCRCGSVPSKRCSRTQVPWALLCRRFCRAAGGGPSPAAAQWTPPPPPSSRRWAQPSRRRPPSRAASPPRPAPPPTAPRWVLPARRVAHPAQVRAGAPAGDGPAFARTGPQGLERRRQGPHLRRLRRVGASRSRPDPPPTGRTALLVVRWRGCRVRGAGRLAGAALWGAPGRCAVDPGLGFRGCFPLRTGHRHTPHPGTALLISQLAFFRCAHCSGGQDVTRRTASKGFRPSRDSTSRSAAGWLTEQAVWEESLRVCSRPGSCAV